MPRHRRPRAPVRTPTALPPAAVVAPVRLVAAGVPSPFLAGRGTVLARVEGDGLAALEIHDGDHVVLERRDHAEHGDIAAVLDDHGQATLWKVYPEADLLRLATGRPGEEQRLTPPPRIHGVVVALLRKPRARGG